MKEDETHSKPKKSRKWLWISLGIILLLIAAGAIGSYYGYRAWKRSKEATAAAIAEAQAAALKAQEEARLAQQRSEEAAARAQAEAREAQRRAEQAARQAQYEAEQAARQAQYESEQASLRAQQQAQAAIYASEQRSQESIAQSQAQLQQQISDNEFKDNCIRKCAAKEGWYKGCQYHSHSYTQQICYCRCTDFWGNTETVVAS